MKRATTRTSLPVESVPEDLLIFRARMKDCGVNVRLPSAGVDYRLPEPFHVEGELLSETVIRLRDGEA